MEWICTDPATNQWGRKIGNKLYEFKEDTYYPFNAVVGTAQAEVNLNDYTDEEIDEILASYGWSIKQLKTEHIIEEAEWLMAECIFEQTAY